MSGRTPATGPVLAAQGLACSRGGRRLFAGLDLSLEQGQIVWLRGANGCGKTSLLRVLAGLAPPDAGQVRRSAAPLYIAHANALKDDLTVLESLAFMARLHRCDLAPASLRGALALLGLDERRNAVLRTLSQGQRRRVALARLGLEPSAALWLLDEPFDALDADGIATLSELLQAHAARGGAALLTSHHALALAEPAPRVFDLDTLCTA